MADVSDATTFEDSGQAISMGKRHLLVRDYVNAVTALAEGCAMLANQYGEMADELGEPFLLYGRALLCLSREEAGVLGNAVPGDGEDEEADEEGDGEGEEAGEKKEGETENDAEKKTNETNADSENNKSEDSTKKSEAKQVDLKDEGPSTSSGHRNGGTASTSHQNGDVSENGEDNDGEEVEEEDDDESSNLQLAWEVLELAKLIILKRGPPGWKLLADTHRLLGEVAMESGNQPGALTDFQACLDLLGRIEPADPRSIAETHYQLGLAYSLGNEFDASIKEFQEAGNLLETRIKELESMPEPPTTEDPFYTIAGEIKELKELLPEINDKIADMRDFKQQTCKLVLEGIKSHVAGGSCSNGAGPSGEGSSSSSGSGAGPSSSKPVSDISHLVRKKRKPEDEEDEAVPSKKISPEKPM